MIEALRFPSDYQQLHEFSDYINAMQFPCRLSESNGELILWVYQQSHVVIVQQLFTQFSQGIKLPIARASKAKHPSLLLQNPVVLLLVVLSFFGFFVVMFNHLMLMSGLSYQGFNWQANTISINAYTQTLQQINSGEWWRLITPIFLHFDVMHVVFNVTILWFLANQIERQQGHIFILMLISVIAIVSNTVQFLYSPDRLFGGMSGVNYGLLSYAFLAIKFDRKRHYIMPQGFFIFSVIMMVLGFFNIFALFGYSIANWAHLAGFSAGAFVFLCVFIIDKYTSL
jgi:GlpG protein